MVKASIQLWKVVCPIDLDGNRTLASRAPANRVTFFGDYSRLV